MAGLRIQDMGYAAARFRPSLQVAAFPTEAYARMWDGRNGRALERLARAAGGPQSPEALALACLLMAAEDPASPVPTTMASNLYRRDVTDRVASRAWEVAERLEEPANFFTTIARSGEVSLEALLDFDPTTFKGTFRSELNDAGALGRDGILFAVLEAEYQSRTGVFRFHWHGVASGGKLAALDNMRDLRAYKSPRPPLGQPKAEVPYRINVAGRPLFNLPKPLTYCIKHWRARWVTEAGKRGRRLRLPPEALLPALLWQHRHTLQDTSLLMGVRPGRDGLIILNSTRMKGGDA